MLHGRADLHTTAFGRPTLLQMDIPERSAGHRETMLEQRKSVRDVVSKRWDDSSVWSDRMTMTLGKERGKVF